MAGASDKARYYLEESVPELRELERKDVFTKQEISSIVRRRTGFECTLATRGSTVSDYVRYAEYEWNLDILRRKRSKRNGARFPNYTGQRRVFFILDRATKKFPGDVSLWMQYVNYARRQGSSKRIHEVMTNMLRLHPTKASLWIYAAQYAIEVRGDVMEARSFLQRGLRFCDQDEHLWLEYGKMEMTFIAKIQGRRHLLGLDEPRLSMEKKVDISEDISDDLVALPFVAAEEVEPPRQLKRLAEDSVSNYKEGPILTGSLVIAVFNAAIKQLDQTQDFALRFFDMVAEFDQLPCQHDILNQIMSKLWSLRAVQPTLLLRYVRLPVIGVDASSPQFPPALGNALSRIKEVQAETSEQGRISFHYELIRWILLILDVSNLNDDLRQVLIITLSKAWSNYKIMVEGSPIDQGVRTAALLDSLGTGDLQHLSQSGRIWAERLWPELLDR